MPRWLIRFILRRIAYGDPTIVTERDVDEYWAPTQLPGFVRAARAALSEFDWSAATDEEASRLAVPTLVVLGRRDRLVPNTRRCRLASRVASRSSGCRAAIAPTRSIRESSIDMIAEFVR